jgi:hypothetical protein
MMKPILSQLKWLVILIILVVATLLTSSCEPNPSPIIVTLPIGSNEPNRSPVIEGLTTNCPRVRPAGSATIECAAFDPDGDELSYAWSADRGNITGKGDIVTWVAPDATGTYTITVTVSDGRGGEATSSWITNSQREGKIIVCTCGSACK